MAATTATTAGDEPAYPPTDRTVPTRLRERARYDRELVHAVLDEGYLCHLGYLHDGAPVVLPTLYARRGERLYLHGSTGSRPVRAAAAPDRRRDGAPQDEEDGLPVCVTVTHVDGLVLAKSAFHHSVNYRSVMVHGVARPVTDPEEHLLALSALVDHVVPGRAADCRPPAPKEAAATAVLALDLREVSAKVRGGGPGEEPEDVSLPHWSGVLPVSVVHGPFVPADGPQPDGPAPDYLTAYARP
ncbi:pyridoxamine 5'-phosphate oxidase family protein [Streptomyces sp. YIM 98790]|uniref:pyridoxamine 5'-phosphate oxidase family protein n=1 Tax=Streptomyces sp. YIM 98790 TaxID=2689077 RepID=UPI001FB739F9|nr:pyridoxamine 5'-phosphate oxidase family protein [Streptomyces sp. YIM 98790]